MRALIESFMAAFDTNAKIVWTTTGTAEASARFAVNGIHIIVNFALVGPIEWQVGFQVEPGPSADKSVHASVRIFSGVFQAVREFLEVRQPDVLVFASKEEALGHIYEAYLQRQGSALAELGYAMRTPSHAAPLVEFALEKTTPSAWRN